LDVSPDEKASALLHCLASTLKRDLVVHRKGAIAKAFLMGKPGESPSSFRFLPESLKPRKASREDENMSAPTEYSFRWEDFDQRLLSPKTQEPKPTEVAPARPELASTSKASELFFAWWPSSSFPNPGWPDVVQNFKCAHRILTTNGFLIVADPENVTGDGKSWVLECKPTAKLPKDADPADLARQYLESEGVKVDEVGQLDESDRTLYVLLGPPPQPITSVEVQEEPQTTRQTKLLQKIYGAVDAHEGENPPTEYGAREPMKRAGQALGVTPTPLPQPEVQRVAATSVTGEALGRDRLPPPPLSPLLIRPSVGEGARQINSRSIRRRPFSVSLRPA